MKTNRNGFLIFLAALFIFLSCSDDSRSTGLLKRAQDIVDTDPREALLLIDSIQNPKDMGKDNYMQYVVARIQARYKNDMDITEETEIFEAQKYFADKKNYAQATLAHNYAGNVHTENKMISNAIKSLLEAEYAAKQAGDNLYAGRSVHSIGFMYEKRNIMDTAIIYYKKALEYYDEDPRSNNYKPLLLNSLGFSYNRVDSFYSAKNYLEGGLKLAKQENNQQVEHFCLNNLAIVFTNTGEYEKAYSHTLNALEIAPTHEDSVRIYNVLAKLYVKTNQPDSAKPYIDLVNKEIPSIKSLPLLVSIYYTTSDYYKQKGDFTEAFRYKELQNKTYRKVIEIDNSDNLTDITTNYKLELKEKELNSVRMRSYLYFAVGVFLIVIITLVSISKYRGIRRKEREAARRAKLLREQYDQKARHYEFLQKIYKNTITRWCEVDKQINTLARHYGATEKPTIFLRVEEVITKLRQEMNEKLIENMKDYYAKQPNGKRILENLSDKDFLFFSLCQSRYPIKEMAFILGVVPSKQNLDLRRLDLRNKLIDAGMPREKVLRLLSL